MPIIVLRREALKDLQSIDSFSRREFGNRDADSYMSAIDAVFGRLAEYPESGVAFRSSKRPMRSAPAGSHRVFYYFDGKQVVIVRILHHAMDVHRHVKR